MPAAEVLNQVFGVGLKELLNIFFTFGRIQCIAQCVNVPLALSLSRSVDVDRRKSARVPAVIVSLRLGRVKNAGIRVLTRFLLSTIVGPVAITEIIKERSRCIQLA
jgi:hypothetical protein